MRDHVETFLAEARRQRPSGLGMPRFIEKEFRRYLECGLLPHGFARVRCAACGFERLVAFSCKGRAVCPSCCTRRMSDTAAHLVDRVLPEQPYRQWVLSMPRWVRCELAYDPALVSKVLKLFLRAIFAWQRLRARRLGLARATTGAVTFVQRFGSALNLNVHFHALVPDGVFVLHDEAMSFVRLAPSDDDVRAIALKVVRRTLGLLESRASDPLQGPIVTEEADPYLGALREAPSLARGQTREPIVRPGRRALYVDGFSVHANVSVGQGKRGALERLARYGARPPVALGRLGQTDDGRIAYRLKHRAPGVGEYLLLSPLELLGKLAALIPPPRVHMVRYHGCFAPNAKIRSLLVPPAAGTDQCESRDRPPETAFPDHSALVVEQLRPRRLDWATLLKRVFAVDVLRCDECGGPMRVLAVLTDPDVTRRILTHLGMPAQAPAPAPARASPDAGHVEQDEPGTADWAPDYDGVDETPGELS